MTIAKRGCSIGMGKSMVKIRLYYVTLFKFFLERLLDINPALATIA
jgi:hypothetical protein